MMYTMNAMRKVLKVAGKDFHPTRCAVRLDCTSYHVKIYQSCHDSKGAGKFAQKKKVVACTYVSKSNNTTIFGVLNLMG